MGATLRPTHLWRQVLEDVDRLLVVTRKVYGGRLDAEAGADSLRSASGPVRR